VASGNALGDEDRDLVRCVGYCRRSSFEVVVGNVMTRMMKVRNIHKIP